MPFQKGHTPYKRKNTTGPYNLTLSQKLIYKHLEKFLKTNITGIQALYDGLDDKDKLYFVESLFNYAIPRQRQMDITSGGAPIKSEPTQVIISTPESSNKLTNAIEKLST